MSGYSEFGGNPSMALSVRMGTLGFKRIADVSVHQAAASGTYDAWSQTQGAELLTNGAFAADTDWTKGTGWTIAAGLASSDATQAGDSDLTQTITPTNLDEYLVTLIISGRTAGNITPVMGSTEGTDRAGNATYAEVITSGAGTDFDIRADLDWDGDVESASVFLVMDYVVGNTVSHGGADYFCIQAHYVGEDDEEPGVGVNWANYWDLVVVHADVTEFVRLQALTACTFGPECVSAEGDNLVAADVLPIGTEIWGRFTRLDLTAGVLLAYYYK